MKLLTVATLLSPLISVAVANVIRRTDIPPFVGCSGTCQISKEIHVISGDTLNKLAAANKVTVAAIVYVNPAVTNPDLITVGQKLLIPTEACNKIAPALPENPTFKSICYAINTPTYIVTKDDTLTIIAAKFFISLKALEGANPQIKNVDKIEINQKVNIPLCTATEAAKGSTSEYKVEKNDTLTKIAGSFAITLKALEAFNPQIKNFDSIDVGDIIKIPVAK